MKYAPIPAAGVALTFVFCVSVEAKTISADIRWTDYGVPHVTAKNFQGLGFGYGFAVARNRLCVLADRAITLRGERSRLYGADGEVIVGFVPTQNLDSDLFHKVQLSDGILRSAEARLSRDALNLATGYADGINTYVKTLSPAALKDKCQGTIIPTFKRSDVIRSMLGIGTIWKGMRVAPHAASSDWGQASKDPAPAKADVAARSSVPAGIGSNAWAYGGDASSVDSAILMANPHTSWNGNDWLLMHQMHLTIPGVIDVAGADFVGIPMPVTGFNSHVAWTLEAPLTVKFYLLHKMTVSVEKATYQFEGKPSALKFKRIVIPVRQPNGRITPRNFNIPISNLGPLYQLPAGEGQPAGWYAITDAGDGNANGLDQLIAMARARNGKEFVAAVENNRGLGVHMIAADKEGMAIYSEAGPLLAVIDAQLGTCRLDAGSSSDILDGALPACTLRDAYGRPDLAKPDAIPTFTTRGIVHNLNNSYHASVYGKPSSGYSALLGSADEHDLRLNMSEKRLGEVLKFGKISPDTALTLALDNRNYAAEQWLDKILKACLQATEKSVLQACETLKKWDRRNDSTSRGPALFSEIWTRLSQVEAYNDIVNDAAVPSAEAALNVQTVIKEAMTHLASLGVPHDGPWGAVMVHGTATGAVNLHGGSGDEGVLNVMQGEAPGPKGYANISNGTGYLQLVYWDKGTVRAKTLLAHGQSSDIASPHYADQLDHFARKELVPFPFEKADVVATTIEQITIDQ